MTEKISSAAKTDLGRVFSALSEDIRLKILRLLVEEGELCVCDLMAALDMGQSRVSFHMAVLKSEGLVVSRRFGRWNSYKLAARKPAQAAVLDLIRNCRTLPVNTERKRLQSYLKKKNQLGPDGKKCCPDVVTTRLPRD